MDTTAVAGVQYYYGEDAFDGGGDLTHALPTGITSVTAPSLTTPFYQSAMLIGQDMVVDYQGDSRTYCQYCSANNGTAVGNTPPYWADYTLQKTLGLRNVAGANSGCDGASAANWVKTAATYSTCPTGGNLYTQSSTAMNALIAADPSATQVFEIMLDANDANQSYTVTAFVANMQSLIISDLTDFPNAKVIVNEGSYFTASIYAGAAVQSLAYSYRAPLQAMVATLAAAYPSRVFMGDTTSWAFFANNSRYATEMQAQTSYGGSQYGTGYIHQLDTTGHNGSLDLGQLWAQATINALYGQQTPRGPVVWGRFK